MTAAQRAIGLDTIEIVKHSARIAADLAEFDSRFRLLAQLTCKLSLCLQRAATPMCIARANRLSKLAFAESKRLKAEARR